MSVNTPTIHTNSPPFDVPIRAWWGPRSGIVRRFRKPGTRYCFELLPTGSMLRGYASANKPSKWRHLTPNEAADLIACEKLGVPVGGAA